MPGRNGPDLGRVVLDAIITLFVELGHSVEDNTVSIATAAPHPPQTQPTLAAAPVP